MGSKSFSSVTEFKDRKNILKELAMTKSLLSVVSLPLFQGD